MKSLGKKSGLEVQTNTQTIKHNLKLHGLIMRGYASSSSRNLKKLELKSEVWDYIARLG